jgi:hypothetical protein
MLQAAPHLLRPWIWRFAEGFAEVAQTFRLTFRPVAMIFSKTSANGKLKL